MRVFVIVSAVLTVVGLTIPEAEVARAAPPADPYVVVAGYCLLGRLQRGGDRRQSGSGIMEIIVGSGGRSHDTSIVSTSPVPTFADVNDFGDLKLSLGSGTTAKLTPTFWREGDTAAFDSPGSITCNT